MSESTRRKLETILAKLRALLPHLGNANDHEAEAARRAINRLLAGVGLDWHDLTSLLMEKEPSLFELFAKLFASDADLLVQLGLAGAKLYHSSRAVTYADVMIDGHRNTFPLSSSDFSDWLLHQFFMEMQKAPGLTAMKTAIRTLGAHAEFKGPLREVFLRVTTHEGKVYLDIGDPNWHVVGDQFHWLAADRGFPGTLPSQARDASAGNS